MPSIGLFLLCCNRPYLTALSLLYYIVNRTERSELHAYVDVPRNADAPPDLLLKLLLSLEAKGVIKSVHIEDGNRGLTYMVSKGAIQLASKYDYICRLEDDILIGPNCLNQLVDVMEKSRAQDERPIALLGGQVDRDHSVLRPIRFRQVNPYTVGIHGIDNLEGLTMLWTGLNQHGFNWSLDHEKAFNNEWLNRVRTAGYEGGCVVTPTIAMQHIGYRTTVPNGTPITPAKCWNTHEIIELPPFDWHLFVNNTVESEPRYVMKVVREICTGLPPEIADSFISILGSGEDKSKPLYVPEPWDVRYSMHLKPAAGPQYVPPTPEPMVAVPQKIPGKKKATAAAGWTDI